VLAYVGREKRHRKNKMLNKYPLTLKNKNVAEFFAGIGLMRIGLERAGWRVSFANDISEQKYEMYAFHFKESKSHFLREDIHKLNEASIPSVTLATASFPCNDLSLAGMREGLSGKQSSAYWGFVKLLEQMGNRRPPLVLLENVAGFLTSHDGRDFQSALLALNRLGYAVDPFIIDAVRFVPQSRVRLFVVGTLQQGQGAWGIKSSSSFYESDIRTKKLAEFIFHHPEIVWNIRQLPRLPQRKIDLAEIIEDLPDDSAYWWGRLRAGYLINQMSDKHKNQLSIMKSKKAWSYGTVFRRVRKECSMAELRNDGIAGCLRTPRGGSGRQILVKAGHEQVMVRLLTPRECARLMGADDYMINTSLNKALFGFGDAVCVPVIEWIAKNYLNPLIDELLAKAESKSHTTSSYRAEAADGN
jgi:DNA (cytosine-5)-methyltransferase 1